MRIKTITCHDVYNYGATLQEFALINFLLEEGHDVEAIRYKPKYLCRQFDLWVVANPKFDIPVLKQIYLLLKLPGRLKALSRKKSFDAFTHKYISRGEKIFASNEELKNDIPDADAYICGSDQIWNSFFQNGKDPAFYLNFVPNDKRKISYAASFAIEEISEDVKPLVKENVSRLHAIGVRETSGVRILNELGIDRAVQVLDPVFLLDAIEWKNKFVKEIGEKFIFIYDFDSNPIIKEIALSLKSELGVSIYTVNRNIDYADKNFFSEGPEMFLSLMYHSQYNITNSFHAVAFSLIFEKPMVVVNRSEKINTRMYDLLNIFGLVNHIVFSKRDFDSLSQIDFESIRGKMHEYIIHSKSFLKDALK